MLYAFAPLALLFGADPVPGCRAAQVTQALGRDAAFVLIDGPVPLVAENGTLSSADCSRAEGGAQLVQILVDPAIDFRERVQLPDGRLVFGGTGGLVAVTPGTLTRTRLTTAPTYAADTATEGGGTCWAAANGKPVAGWDRAPRAAGPGRILFERGGPCGYEGEPIRTTMVVDLGDGTSTRVRPARDVPALVVTSSGAVVLGDGGSGCQEPQTRGAVWLSLWGGPFLPVPFAPRELMGVVALGESKDGALWALTGICQSGGAARGGNLWRAPRGGTGWEEVVVPVPRGGRGVDVGQGLAALRVQGAEVRVAHRAASGEGLVWQATRDGKRWKKAREPKAPSGAAAKAMAELAVTLGVGKVHGLVAAGLRRFAHSDDGAFVQVGVDGDWTRVFP